jgi:hypothetical protein
MRDMNRVEGGPERAGGAQLNRPAAPTPPASPRLLFVAGMMRSGTTLVAKALSGHPDVFAAGELANLWRWARINGHCSCGTPIRDCAVWSGVIADVQRDTGLGIEQLDELQSATRRLWARPGEARRNRALPGDGYGEVLRLTLAAVVRATGKPVVVDTSKNLRPVAAYEALDVVFLHLVRDPRGVAMSEAHHTVWPGVAAQELPPVRSAARSAITWDLFNLVCERALRRVDPTRRRRLRYEDLVARPADVLDGLTVFAGLRAHDWQLDEGRLWLPEGHLMCGNPMRYAAGWTPVQDRQSWRSGLSGRERQVVQLWTAPLRSRYGYRD